jgi:hypothetical protein
VGVGVAVKVGVGREVGKEGTVIRVKAYKYVEAPGPE